VWTSSLFYEWLNLLIVIKINKLERISTKYVKANYLLTYIADNYKNTNCNLSRLVQFKWKNRILLCELVQTLAGPKYQFRVSSSNLEPLIQECFHLSNHAIGPGPILQITKLFKTNNSLNNYNETSLGMITIQVLGYDK